MNIVIEEAHLATVVSIADPESLGRIRVTCQALLDGEDEDLPQWIRPLALWGWFVVPDVGETVEIVAVTGATQDESPGMVSISGLNLRWRGLRQWGNTETEQKRPIPDDFKTNYGKRRGFATPAGHIIWFDDTEGAEAIQMKWANKNGDQATFDMGPDGSIVLTNKGGATIAMDATQKTVLVADENDNSIKLENGKITVHGATKVIVEAPEIEIGGNTHTIGFGDVIESYLAGHTHTCPAASAPTSPPVSPPTGLGSSAVKVGG